MNGTAAASSAADWLAAVPAVRSTVRSLAAGETLFRQGDPTVAIFAVEDGLVRLVRHTVEAQPVVLHVARRGALFAEAALFSGDYHCDAVAALPSRIRAYPKPDLLAAFRADPALAERFMALLARQVQGLRARLEERNIRSASTRLLHHIALAAGPDGRTMRLDGTLSDLAAEIGLTREALYRALAKLEKAGAIRRSATAITLQTIAGT